MNAAIALFEQKEVRKVWDVLREKRFFSIIDVIEVLTESTNPQVYRRVFKKRLLDEWANETVTKCNELKMLASDGKMRTTDCFSTEDLLRLIQSIPSPKAEPFKQWLAKVWYERIQEITDPEISINRARENRQKYGRSEKRIQQRMTWQETRNKLTDYRRENDVNPWDEFAILTNIIHQERTWLSVKDHKDLKDLKSHNLRDHMSEAELIFTALAELSTRQIAETSETKWLDENKVPAKEWWQIAKNARKALEKKTWKDVVTWANFLPKNEKKNQAFDEIKTSGIFSDLDEESDAYEKYRQK